MFLRPLLNRFSTNYTPVRTACSNTIKLFKGFNTNSSRVTTTSSNTIKLFNGFNTNYTPVTTASPNTTQLRSRFNTNYTPVLNNILRVNTTASANTIPLSKLLLDGKCFQLNISSGISNLTKRLFQNTVSSGNQCTKRMHHKYVHGNDIDTNIIESMTTNHSKSLESWQRDAEGPFIVKNRKVTQYNRDMKLELPPELPCRIFNQNLGNIHQHGLGCYFGNSHVLTAYHVIKDTYRSKINVVFYTTDSFLIYSAEFNRFCRIYPKRDLGTIKLIGDTSPLGEGLFNRVSEVHKDNNVYFYTINDMDRFQKLEGKVIDPRRLTAQGDICTVSVAGREGDSGSPVYSNGRLVGVYCGILRHTQQGYFSKLIQN